MASKLKSPEQIEKEYDLQLTELREGVKQIRSVPVEKLKDALVLFGPTKAGKSTLLNALLDIPLIVRKHGARETIYITKAPGLPGPAIGHEAQSETEGLHSYGILPGTCFVIYDSAGLWDNKGALQETLNAVAYQNVLLQQKSVRFVLVVPLALLTSLNPKPLYKLLYSISMLSPVIGDSLCIVFSQGERGKLDQLLEVAKNHVFDKADENERQMQNSARRLIEKVHANGAFSHFKIPVLPEDVDEGVFVLPNKQELINCIKKKLKGMNLKNFPLLVSSQVKLGMAEHCEFLYRQVQGQVKMVEASIEQGSKRRISEIKEAKQENGKPISETSKLALFKQRKSVIEIAKNSTSVEEVLKRAVSLGVAISDKLLGKVKDFHFIDGLKNLHITNDGGSSIELESEVLGDIKVAFMRSLDNYSDLITASAAASEKEQKEEEQQLECQKKEMANLQAELVRTKKANEAALARAKRPLNIVCVIL